MLAVLDFFYLMLLVTAPFLLEPDYEQDHQPVKQDHHHAKESEASLRFGLRIMSCDWPLPIIGRLFIKSAAALYPAQQTVSLTVPPPRRGVRNNSSSQTRNKIFSLVDSCQQVACYPIRNRKQVLRFRLGIASFDWVIPFY